MLVRNEIEHVNNELHSMLNSFPAAFQVPEHSCLGLCNSSPTKCGHISCRKAGLTNVEIIKSWNDDQ
jgi:hypothetical protein